jgi:hypothetical protein
VVGAAPPPWRQPSLIIGFESREPLTGWGESQVVVMTDCGLEAACKWDAYCHAHTPPIPFIRTETRGLFGTIFCDFGPAFTIVDLDGTRPCPPLNSPQVYMRSSQREWECMHV